MTKNPSTAGARAADVVEAAGVASGAGVGVHRHLIMRVYLMDSHRHLRDEPGEAGLVRAARALEVDVDAVEVLGSNRPYQGGRQCRRSARR